MKLKDIGFLNCTFKRGGASCLAFKNKKAYAHRTDGPAYEYCSGFKSWWLNGERHRFRYPAIIWEDGQTSYWEKGKMIKEK